MSDQNISLRRRRALLATVDTYDSEALPNLEGVKTDLINIKDAFISNDIQVEYILKNPSKNEFLQKVIELLGSANDTDYIFIYFSGHGFNFNNKDYLVFRDAFLDNPLYIDQFLLDTSLSGVLSDSNACEIVFFIDACREGISLTSKAISIGKFKLKKISKSRSRLYTVFSCQANKYSRLIDNDKGSLFTYSLCKALNAREYGAGTLKNVLNATDLIIKETAVIYKLPVQKTYVLEEKSYSELITYDIFPAGLHILQNNSVGRNFSSHPNSDFLWPSFTGLEELWRRGFFGQDVTVYAVDESAGGQHLEFSSINFRRVFFSVDGQTIKEPHRVVPRGGNRQPKGHGSAVLSLVCGKNIGVAPRCNVVNLAALRDGRGYTASILAAFNYCSNDESASRSILLIPIKMTASKSLNHMLEVLYKYTDILIIASAGNNISEGISYPAALPFVISVGGVNKSGEIEKFSDFISANKGEPDIYGIATVLHADNATNFSYSPGISTSYAAAYVAGIAALMWSAFPNITRNDLHAKLLKSGIYPKGRLGGAKILTIDSQILSELDMILHSRSGE